MGRKCTEARRENAAGVLWRAPAQSSIRADVQLSPAFDNVRLADRSTPYPRISVRRRGRTGTLCLDPPASRTRRCKSQNPLQLFVSQSASARSQGAMSSDICSHLARHSTCAGQARSGIETR